MNPFLPSDAQLVSNLANGDRKAFRDLYERYQEEMYRLALRKTHEKEVAEEIVQDVFVNLWENRHQAEIGLIRNYLLRSVRNRVLDYIRAQIVRRNYARQFASRVEEFGNTTADLLALHELSNAIETAMGAMPEKTREIFQLNRREMLSAGEISKLLSLPKRTVEYHITVALRTMRMALKDFLPLWIVLFSS